MMENNNNDDDNYNANGGKRPRIRKFSFKTTKKEKQMLVFLTLFYFLVGPFQTSWLIERHYPLPMIQIVDNYGGWAFLVITSFVAYRFYKSGTLTEAIVEIITAFQNRKKEEKE